MTPLTADDIRAAFVNASKREAREASVPDLTDVPWERTEVLGWTDEKRPGMSYVVLDSPDGPRAVLVRPAATKGPRKKMLCSWCEDVTNTENVIMYIAARAGASGRKGDVVGTAVCIDFSCSRNARRTPSIEEVGKASPEEVAYLVDQRVAGLRERCALFLAKVLHA